MSVHDFRDLARAAEDHLAALVQHARDELRRLRLLHGHELGAGDDLRQAIGRVPGFPFAPRLRAEAEREQTLHAHFAIHGAAAFRAAREARRILVLPVEPAALEPIPDDVHAAAILGGVRRIHAHPGVERLVAGINQRRHRQPAGEDRGELLLLRNRRAFVVAVELHEDVAKRGHVFVLRAAFRHRVDAQEQAERRGEALLDAAFRRDALLPLVARHRHAARRHDLAGIVFARRRDGDELRGPKHASRSAAKPSATGSGNVTGESGGASRGGLGSRRGAVPPDAGAGNGPLPPTGSRGV